MTESSPTGLAARPSATGKERISSLDGVRAVALLIIMGYHFGVGWLGGGFFSLDIFYVLSGYLITGLLVGEYRKRGDIKLSAFWLRRARRLLPALLIVLVAVTVMIRFAEPAGLYPDFRMSALSALFYFSNWWQIAANGNYFVATGAVSPLTHTWSLAVEEQFYLIWPLVVLAVMGLSRSFARGIRALLVLSVVGAVGSAVEMAVLYRPSDITRLYFGTDTHAQSILIGAALACVMTIIQMRRGAEGMAPRVSTRTGRYVVSAVGLAGLAGTLTLAYTLDGTASFDYRGGFMLSALSAAAVIIGAVCVSGGPVDRLLSVSPLVWLGTISYGAYLWHYPIYVYLDASRTGLVGLSLLAVRFAATVLLAATSFYLVERPVMYGTFWRSLKAAAPAAVLLVATVAVVVVGTSGAASAIPSPGSIAAQGDPSGGHGVPVLMVGDSTALTLAAILGYTADRSGYGLDIIDKGSVGCGIAEGSVFESDGVTSRVPSACNPSASKSAQWPALLEGWLARYRPRVVVLLAGRWEVYDRTDPAGKMTNITQSGYAGYIRQQLERFVGIASSTGSRVVLMTAPYYDSGEQPDGQPLPQDDPARVRDYNRLVRSVADSDPRTVSLVDLNALVSPGGRFASTIGGIVVRAPDGVHFPFFDTFEDTAHAPDTAAQTEQFAAWIGPVLDVGGVGREGHGDLVEGIAGDVEDELDALGLGQVRGQRADNLGVDVARCPEHGVGQGERRLLGGGEITVPVVVDGPEVTVVGSGQQGGPAAERLAEAAPVLAGPPEADQLGGDRIEGVETGHGPDEGVECLPDPGGRRSLYLSRAPARNRSVEGVQCRRRSGEEIDHEHSGYEVACRRPEVAEDRLPLPVGDGGHVQAELGGESDGVALGPGEAVGLTPSLGVYARPPSPAGVGRWLQGSQAMLSGTHPAGQLDQISQAGTVGDRPHGGPDLRQ
jgi:peptidoglycan/LPS O-acetylase OafA/YrhL